MGLIPVNDDLVERLHADADRLRGFSLPTIAATLDGAAAAIEDLHVRLARVLASTRSRVDRCEARLAEMAAERDEARAQAVEALLGEESFW